MIEQVISILSLYIGWKSHEVFSADLSSAEGHALQQALKQQRDPIVGNLLDFVIGENSQVTEPVKRAVSLFYAPPDAKQAKIGAGIPFCDEHAPGVLCTSDRRGGQ